MTEGGRREGGSYLPQSLLLLGTEVTLKTTHDGQPPALPIRARSSTTESWHKTAVDLVSVNNLPRVIPLWPCLPTHVQEVSRTII